MWPPPVFFYFSVGNTFFILLGMETIIALAIAATSYAWRRYLSGLKNAAFYLKGRDFIRGDSPTLRKIRRAVSNLHFVETPAWYTQAGSFAPLLYIIARYQGIGPLWAAVAAVGLTMAASAIAGPFYQCPINVQEGKRCIAPDERKKSEFAWGAIRFWWPRPWFGYRRIVGACVGLAIWAGALAYLWGRAAI
jgi:hypothetical protein